MTVDNTRLLSRLPDAYEKRQAVDGQANGNWLLMQGVAAGTEPFREAIASFESDQTIATATGDGLDRLAARYKIHRPPWMGDAQFQTLLGIWVSMPMCTLQKIKAIFDAYTGLSCTIADIVTNGSIPAGEIWLTFPAGYPSLKGRWFAPGLGATVRSRRPVSSGIAGVIYGSSGRYGGMFNDHITGIDSYLDKLLNRAKAAGTTIVYKS